MSKDAKKEKSTKEKTQSSYQKGKDAISKDLTDNVFRKKRNRRLKRSHMFALA